MVSQSPLHLVRPMADACDAYRNNMLLLLLLLHMKPAVLAGRLLGAGLSFCACTVACLVGNRLATHVLRHVTCPICLGLRGMNIRD